jgi:hypothetical protein
MPTDTQALLRDLRPDPARFDPDSPAARASLERILAAPPAPPRRRRRAPRLALAGSVAVLAVAAVALAPSLRDSPDVVARAAAALAPPDTILHFKAEIRARESPPELRAGRPDDTVDSVVESWQGDGRARSVLDGGRMEIVMDTTTGRGEQYVKLHLGSNRPDVESILPIGPRDTTGLGAPTFPSGVVGDLALLLDRARAGAPNLHLVGETSVRGIPAYELRLDFSDGMRMSRLIYISREDYLPLRVVERGPHGEIWTITDYIAVERLPIDAQTRAQLRMSPHPGVR